MGNIDDRKFDSHDIKAPLRLILKIIWVQGKAVELSMHAVNQKLFDTSAKVPWHYTL